MHADRRCEACYADWRGGPECPTCGHVAPTITICAWCPGAEFQTKMAIAAGHVVTHGLCLTCAGRF